VNRTRTNSLALGQLVKAFNGGESFEEHTLMAVITEDVMPRFEIGRVVSRTFQIIGNNLLSFAMLSVIPGVPLV
jgi:hypothetical protein